MNLPTTNSTHYFILKDGVMKQHQAALQSAIDNAIEVSNQKEVEKQICDRIRVMVPDFVYSLQCRVKTEERRRYKRESGIWTKWYAVEPSWVDGEEHESKTVALVTFDQASEPKQEMNSEELNKVFDWAKCGIYHNHAYHEEKLQACLDVLERFKNSISKSEPGDSEKGDGWIDIYDQLPEQGTRVLIAYKFGVAEGFYWGSRFLKDLHTPFPEATHWQPLPEPPRKREVK